MARSKRIDAIGVIHHVTARGVERRTIFEDVVDLRAFVARLLRLLSELGFTCLAWALIPNHFHLLVRRNKAPLSQLMARLNGPFAQRFNRRHVRVGHLFQDRFVSRPILDDADLIGVMRYVLFNPVRHRVVSARELERYPWCAYGALVGSRRPYEFEATSEALAVFDANKKVARARLRAALAELAPEISPATRVEVIAQAACEHWRVPRGAIGSRQPEATCARAEVSVRAVVEFGIRPRVVAEVLGISRAVVHRAVASSRLSQRGGGV